MNAQRVGADLADQIAQLGAAHLSRLDRSDVSQKERGGRKRSNTVSGALFGTYVHGSLASKAEADAALFGDARQLLVYASGLFRTSGHRCDDDRRTQTLAQQDHGGVDVRDAAIGQSVVDEPNALEQRRHATKPDVLVGAYREMIGLSLTDLAHPRPEPSRRLALLPGSLQRNVKVAVDTCKSASRAVDDRGRGPYAPRARMTRAEPDSIPTGVRGKPMVSPTETPLTRDPFTTFATRVRAEVEARLADWLDARVAEAVKRGADVGVVADAVRRLTMRGGKRMRPVLLAAAYEGCAGEGGSASVAQAGIALELFQAYLLTHDDWMDGDALRRGGPSVPAMMHERFGRAHADEMSVLAGDLAAAWSKRALLEIDLPSARVLRAAAELARVEEEVVEGQVLDVAGSSRSSAAVEAMHSLKTASYSVRGPVVMGALLAGATDAQIATLASFAEPLGVAFQLRDDLLGVFGDVNATGKPAGSDLRKGKYSAVLVETAGANESVERVFGRSDASDHDVSCAIASLEASGAPERVEARIRELVSASLAALEGAQLTVQGRGLLTFAAAALTERRS